MNKEIPLGIKIVGTLWIISGIGVFIRILQYFYLPIDNSVLELSPYDPVIGIFYFFLGIGIIKIKQWARRVTLIIAIIGIPISAYNIIFKDIQNGAAEGMGSLIVNSILLFYFTRKDITTKYDIGNKNINV